jgi:hypothetical protein
VNTNPVQEHKGSGPVCWPAAQTTNFVKIRKVAQLQIFCLKTLEAKRKKKAKLSTDWRTIYPMLSDVYMFFSKWPDSHQIKIYAIRVVPALEKQNMYSDKPICAIQC